MPTYKCWAGPVDGAELEFKDGFFPTVYAFDREEGLDMKVFNHEEVAAEIEGEPLVGMYVMRDARLLWTQL